MKKFFIVVCFIATLLDLVGTMLGLCVAAKVKALPGYIVSSVGALIVIALMLSTRDILKKQDKFHRCMRTFWFMGLWVNILTVFFAASNHIILERAISDSISIEWSQVYDANLIQLATIGIMTIFLAAAPIATSYLADSFFETEGDYERAAEPNLREKVSI